MNILKHDVETLVLKVFNEFSMSTKRVDELKKCFEFVEQDFHNVLRHRYSCKMAQFIYNAVDRLILN